jgi:hypothetical protein
MATFSYTLPTVGGSEDTWGTTLNANWTALGTFLGSLDSAELAVLDGITSTTAELNLLSGLTNSLSGLTATATELNLLDGATVTTAEINILDGLTATTAEINILDGDTAATATTLVDADRLVANDDGTMVQVAMTDLLTYVQSNISVGTVPPAAEAPVTYSYTLGPWNVGKYLKVDTGGSVTIPDATFSEGDVVSIFNNTSGDITITCSITTAYIAGNNLDKASVTLATRGTATILFISDTVCVMSGNLS